MMLKDRIKFVLAMMLIISLSTSNAQWKVKEDAMLTPWGKEVTPQNAWQEYPRPQLERGDWMNLNGLWDYSVIKATEKQPSKYQGKILVPFAVESALSGVTKSVQEDDRIWYRRTFSIPSGWKGKSVILNFEAVDWNTTVWVNGALVGAHKGAYDRFSFDITSFLKSGSNELVVSVTDPTSLGTQARGKQQNPQEGIWYTPVSGIWQTVWVEAVSPAAWIKEVKLTPDIDQKTISVIPILNYPPSRDLYQVQVEVFDKGKSLGTSEVAADHELIIDVDDPKLWSPDSPFLYDLKLTLKNKDGQTLDEVTSYFGMRKISLGDHQGIKYLFLNNEPLFHYGPLDQGWWPDGLHTPPSDAGMRWDIEKTKAMGFNAIRKHIKVEPDRWYYHCDQLGMLVWQDMPSGMVVLPPKNEGDRKESVQHVGRTGPDLFRRTEETAQFEYELRRMIDLRYNSPSIVIWVPFNEGWGQYATCRISDMVKAYDPSRLVNAVSGWALRPCGDIYDIHTYQVEVHVPPTSLSQATVIGEYGGIGYPIKGHQWNPEMRNWGYQTYHSDEDLLKNYIYKFDQIVEMKKSKGLSAAIYTQTTDVEGEVNGLITYDREVIKFPEEKLKEMHSVLYE